MDTTVTPSSSPRQTGTKGYYLRSGLENIPIDTKFLFCIGLLFLITGHSRFDIYSIVVSIFLMSLSVREFLKFRRNSGRPFIVLEPYCFKVGWPEIRIPYADVNHFAFDQSRLDRDMVAFSLFPRHKETVAGLKGSHPVGLKEGRVVCPPVKLEGAMAEAFFEDFGFRLKAFGAVNALTDPDSAAGINSITGEALIMPKAPLSAWLIKFGTFTNMQPSSLKWVSYRLGSMSTLFLVFTLLAVAKDYPQWDFNLTESILNSLIIVPFVTVLMAGLQEGLIHYFDRVPGIASFMEKTGERKKLLLGATVGAAICLSVIVAFISLINALH